MAAVGCTHLLYGVFYSLQGSDFHCHKEENSLWGEKVRGGEGEGRGGRGTCVSLWFTFCPPDCDILIQGDQSISRKHATICVEVDAKVLYVAFSSEIL